MNPTCFESIEIVSKKLNTDLSNGLSEHQLENSKKKFGCNVLPPTKKKSFLSLILEQFEDLLVLILLGSAAVSFVLGFIESKETLFEAFVEPFVILLILIANAAVGVWQEINASNAIEKLKEFECKRTSVVRNGNLSVVDSVDLVPGDLIRLSVGERVPADCRISSITTAGLFMCNESMLTGETVSKAKIISAIPQQERIVVQDMKNTLFSGSLVVKGRCYAVVTKTGAKTELGKIYKQLDSLSLEKSRTPLQEKLDVFAAQLSKIILVICILVWLINIKHFTDPEHGGVINGAIYYFKIAVTLAVAAIPEGLPAVVTTCLALGTTRMAKRKAIVRSLPSVETLGCTTVVCSDKTGTLTTNKMNVQSILVLGENGQINKYKVSGIDYKSEGSLFNSKNEKIDKPLSDQSLSKLLEIGSLCNESNLILSENSQETSGMPIEIALRVLANKMNYETNGKRILFFDFDRKRKMMSTIDLLSGGKAEKSSLVAHVKGAPEYIIQKCESALNSNGQIIPLNKTLKDELLKKVIEQASNGLRMLGFAFKGVDDIFPSRTTPEDYTAGDDGFFPHESHLIFTGAVGIRDPPRPEVKSSIEQCLSSGIKVKVITGDHKATAESICREIGLMKETDQNKSLTGQEFMSLTPDDKRDVAESTLLFSRVEPAHKLELVRILKANGHVVAMTGDGVNDASALQCADIGVAMGSGTQVAQQASDIILQDDNFATIVGAIREGRTIYTNTKQFIRYLISSNVGEVVCVFLIAFLGLPEALLPVQLLWVNLVTDGLPATALGFNPPDLNAMRIPPRRRSAPLVDGWLFVRYLVIGLYIGITTILGFVWWYLLAESGPKLSWEQLTWFYQCGRGSDLFASDFDCGVFHNTLPSTMALTVLVCVEMFNTFNALSENKSLIEVPPSRNLFVVAAVGLSMLLHCAILYIPFFQNVFNTSPLGTIEWMVVLELSAPVILMDEFLKRISRTDQ